MYVSIIRHSNIQNVPLAFLLAVSSLKPKKLLHFLCVSVRLAAILKKADCVGLELTCFTVKGWAQVNVAHLNVYVIENMAVVKYGSTSKFSCFFGLYCTRCDKKNSKVNEGREVEDMSTN